MKLSFSSLRQRLVRSLVLISAMWKYVYILMLKYQATYPEEAFIRLYQEEAMMKEMEEQGYGSDQNPSGPNSGISGPPPEDFGTGFPFP